MTVSTKYGKISGVREGDAVIYKGIPYAKPPVGGLRFRPPQEPESWEGVLAADKWPNKCMQPGQQPGSFYEKEFYTDPAYMPPSSEDCLYLNVWTPAERRNEKLPVAFWIHGGAFMNGFGSEIEFDGQEYARRGVILVTINYRCGIFGFFSCRELSEEQGGISGNYGILDQIAALRWVYDNITSFGGDPDNITVFGQSAGAISVQTIVSSPLTKGLVRRAIMQSAGGYKTGFNRERTPEQAEENGEALMKEMGVATLTELRAMPAEELLKKSLEAAFDGMSKGGGGPGLPFAPFVDNRILVDSYDASVEKGLTHDIDYMLGSTANDIGITPEMLGKGEKGFLYEGCVNWSLKQRELGRRPSYVYYFTRRMPGDDAGAFHSAELWYVFNTLGRCWRPLAEADHELSRRMVGYWTNFMKKGDPNGPGLPEWRPCTAEDRFVMAFDIVD
jgi:para-nitrobenzyl esterase